MKEKDQHNSNNWAERLKQYNAVQPGMLNKEESWEILRARLYDKPKRKKRPYWYWAAAACIALFIAIKLFYPAGNKPVKFPGTTQREPVLKGNKGLDIPSDSTRTEEKMVIKSLDPVTNKNRIKAKDSGMAVEQKPVIPLLPGDSSPDRVKDSSQDDLVQEPARLPSVHLNDITGKEPLPKDISIQSLTVKKAIRLFGTDMTNNKSSRNKQKIPDTVPAIPDNQN